MRTSRSLHRYNGLCMTAPNAPIHPLLPTSPTLSCQVCPKRPRTGKRALERMNGQRIRPFTHSIEMLWWPGMPNRIKAISMLPASIYRSSFLIKAHNPHRNSTLEVDIALAEPTLLSGRSSRRNMGRKVIFAANHPSLPAVCRWIWRSKSLRPNGKPATRPALGNHCGSGDYAFSCCLPVKTVLR